MMLNSESSRTFGCYLSDATKQQVYKIVCMVVRNILMKKRRDFHKKFAETGEKQVYYMSMEFLVGTSLKNNLHNLGMEAIFANILRQHGITLEELYEMEPDAGLGNGGLGRLASCYMDSATTLGLPITGFSIRYEFGIFRQKIIDGWQMEFPDDWLERGDVWLNPRTDESYEVRLGGRIEGGCDQNGNYQPNHVDYDTVIAVPYDMMISGYSSDAVNKLVLWSAKAPKSLDMSAFSRGEYAKALEENTRAEVISKVLYPADDHTEGKILRLKQQYVLVSASVQSIIKTHLRRHGSLDTLPDKAAIHINDTHPALCVPELMRILMDEHGYSWDAAWDITCRTLTYTNHTVMSEALERWPASIFAGIMPRIWQIVCEINRRLEEDLRKVYHDDDRKIAYMLVVANNEVRMANLCLCCCHAVNGVSALHSEILTKSIFKDYFYIAPEKFTNVTNGIAYRRWLCQANPALTELLKGLIGHEFIENAERLSDLMKYKDDKQVHAELEKIKLENKKRLANYIVQANGISVDPNSMFDVQIKRLHEYKRQLLNALHILHLYNTIKDNPDVEMTPRTFLFAAKASSGYLMAKQVIRLIVAVANLVNSDPAVNGKLKVVFLEDYKVSLAELIIPAAELSEQISVAGKEASGTGNMKLMINGAVTIGTMDGANVEIFRQVGRENMFLFGMDADGVEALWQRGYRPQEFVDRSPALARVLSMLTSGVLGARFDDIRDALLTDRFGVADPFMTLADFDDYARAQDLAGTVYTNRSKFNSMSLVNIAQAGVFSADRAIKEYCNKIWNINKY
ncbi:MAG: glycogen/starch/alpha-glucan phosphorylase [Ruminococcaceae bacterium]|nr:glycogen/starch/alpha-glucan phosphorylase [Oscillospiraceae bacterium]